MSSSAKSTPQSSNSDSTSENGTSVGQDRPSLFNIPSSVSHRKRIASLFSVPSTAKPMTETPKLSPFKNLNFEGFFYNPPESKRILNKLVNKSNIEIKAEVGSYEPYTTSWIVKNGRNAGWNKERRKLITGISIPTRQPKYIK
jgi:hypothetical protein